ncbi:S1 family peptidase [Bacillus cereus]|uniref:S1 family peptidase n=1 Tax=Bacillus cereus TaxID=1396 RepID=UPI0015583EAB|nr:serine protease [Bacillus cereus]
MEEIIIGHDELAKMFPEFKEFSGKHLVRILKIKDSKIEALGSGGLLKYKDRYFVITNAHVINGVEDKREIRIPYIVNDGRTYSMEVLDIKFNLPADIAILEISLDDKFVRSKHEFLDTCFIDTDLKGYVDRTNILYLHGYPSGGTNIDEENMGVDIETLPYCTFVAEFDEEIGSLYAHIDKEVRTEFGDYIPTPVVTGMSGSFVFGYYLEKPTFKVIGILTAWHIDDEILEIYPIQEFIDYIDQNYFSNL